MDRASFYIVDAFTGEVGGRALRGNPAAVVLLDEFGTDSQMRERANEFNLSETAFVVARENTNFDLRWFTPLVEVNLCGHATLAAARALQDAGKVSTGDSISFSTRSGSLTAKIEAERIELNFPSQVADESALAPSLREALKISASDVLFCGRASEDWLLRVVPGVLETLTPDFKKLSKIEARGVTVTSEAPRGSECDFASRFFCPRVGIDEDPVTGSAHTYLTPFWAQRLDKQQLRAVQLSQRGGLLEVKMAIGGERVAIAGRAQIRAQGHLRD